MNRIITNKANKYCQSYSDRTPSKIWGQEYQTCYEVKTDFIHKCKGAVVLICINLLHGTTKTN